MEELTAVRRKAIAALADAGVPSPGVNVDLLLCHVLGISRSELKLRELRGDSFEPEAREEFTKLIAARRTRIPLQHLTGVAHFRYLELKVGPGVFTPRPETESVVQLGLDFIAEQHLDAPQCIDLCSGSGAIAAALASEIPGSRVWAVELSDEAIGYTRANAEPHQVIVLHQDATQLPNAMDGTMDLVVSNPPYIPPNAIPREVEVRDHDPQMALYGLGEDGLQIPRAVSKQAMKLLRPGGFYVMEHAEVQREAAVEMLQEAGFTNVSSHDDLTGRPRATCGYAPHR